MERPRIPSYGALFPGLLGVPSGKLSEIYEDQDGRSMSLVTPAFLQKDSLPSYTQM